LTRDILRSIVINTVEHPRASLNGPLELIIGVAERVRSYMTRFEKTGFPATGVYIQDGVLSLPMLVKTVHIQC
jgi:hypothetical protein